MNGMGMVIFGFGLLMVYSLMIALTIIREEFR